MEKDTSRILRQLRQITLQIVAENPAPAVQQEYTINLMPEQYMVDEPGRVTVTQTRGGAFVDNFGPGIGTLTMSGTTGFSETRNVNKGSYSPDTVDGYERWVGLRDFFRKFFANQAAHPEIPHYMHFLNWTQEDYYKAVPTGLPRLQRSVAQALLFRYEISLTVLTRLEEYPYDERLNDKLAELLQQTQRTEAIAARMFEQLNRLHSTLLTDIRNSSFVPGLTAGAKDSYTDQFLNNLLLRNGPPGTVLPTDSPFGLAARTRTLAQKATDYAQGRAAVIDSTAAEVKAVTSGWRSALDAVDFAAGLPASYAREVKETLCSVQSLGQYPQLFRSSVQGTLAALSALLQDSGCATTLGL